MGPGAERRWVTPRAPRGSELRSRALSSAPALVGVRRSCKLFSRLLCLVSVTTQIPSGTPRPKKRLWRRDRDPRIRARGRKRSVRAVHQARRPLFLCRLSGRKARATPRTICSRRAKAHGTWALERSWGWMRIRAKKPGVRRRRCRQRARGRHRERTFSSESEKFLANPRSILLDSLNVLAAELPEFQEYRYT